MRELFARWAQQKPKTVTTVTELSPAASPENHCIHAVSPLSPVSPLKNNDALVKPKTEILGAVTSTDLSKNCGDSGDKGDRLKSLDNSCHQHAKQCVTTVTNWPGDPCRQRKPEPITELQQESAAWNLNQREKERNHQQQVITPKLCVIRSGVCEVEVDHKLHCLECGVNNHLPDCTIPACPIREFKNVPIRVMTKSG